MLIFRDFSLRHALCFLIIWRYLKNEGTKCSHELGCLVEKTRSSRFILPVQFKVKLIEWLFFIIIFSWFRVSNGMLVKTVNHGSIIHDKYNLGPWTVTGTISEELIAGVSPRKFLICPTLVLFGKLYFSFALYHHTLTFCAWLTRSVLD